MPLLCDEDNLEVGNSDGLLLGHLLWMSSPFSGAADARGRSHSLGLLSREKGNKFERECVHVLPLFTFGAVWRRCPIGRFQERGDLYCDAAPFSGWYVECRRRQRITFGPVSRWWQEVCEKGSNCQWLVLCVREDGGPLQVFQGPVRAKLPAQALKFNRGSPAHIKIVWTSYLLESQEEWKSVLKDWPS